MIANQQLVTALERLAPHDRELLELSLRRRVPDEALGTLFDIEVGEVARRRANAIERLSEVLDLERGEDLGHVLKALLDPDTWTAIEVDRDAEPADQGSDDGEPRPVLELLAERPDPEANVDEEPPLRRRGRRLTRWAFVAGVLALAASAGVAALALTNDEGNRSNDRASEGTRPFVPQESGPSDVPFPSDPGDVEQHLTAFVRGDATLYRSPDGPRLARIDGRTRWGSARVLAVVERRGDWLGVLAPELENGQVGWIPAGRARLGSTIWSLHADLSRRTLEVRKRGQTVRRLKVAIGRKQNPTPTGRFAVTDKLRVSDRSSPYGCCVLALTGHQRNLPPDWPGGDRLAVHASQDTNTIGQPVSLGCMRAPAKDARWLIETVPLGAPLTVGA